MKRLIRTIIIFCASIIAPSVISQSLQLSDVSGTIPNGTIIHVWDTSTVIFMSAEVDVKNISSGTVTIKAKKIENSLIPGTSCNLCFAGQCFTSSIFITLNSSTLAPNDIDTSFAGDYKPNGHLGESIVTFVFFNVDNEDDSAWVVVHFNGTAAGINEHTVSTVEISNPYPNPAVNYTSFNYSFPANTISTRFVLCDLLGSKVNETEISDQKSRLIINTSRLNDGIYFYSFYVNDKMILTKKLIVHH